MHSGGIPTLAISSRRKKQINHAQITLSSAEARGLENCFTTLSAVFLIYLMYWNSVESAVLKNTDRRMIP